MQDNFWMSKSIQPLFFMFMLIALASCNNNNQKNEILADSNLPDSVAEGKKLFEATCVRCHGMDGSGLTGPSLKRQKLMHAPDVASFTAVVEMGIAGTGMPSNWAFTDSDCHQLYAYINHLINQGMEEPKGDSAEGSKVYSVSGCATCHVMNGQGNSVGPELTDISASRNLSYLRQAIIDPGATLPESTDIDNGY